MVWDVDNCANRDFMDRELLCALGTPRVIPLLNADDMVVSHNRGTPI